MGEAASWDLRREDYSACCDGELRSALGSEAGVCMGQIPELTVRLASADGSTNQARGSGGEAGVP